MTDETRADLDKACELVGDEMAGALVRDVSGIVSDGLKSAFGKEESEGFFEQIVKPYVTAYVYHSVAAELTRRAEQNKALVDAAVERRYS